MSLSKAIVYDGQLQKQVQAGDVVAGGEIIPATIVTNAITVTATQLAQAFVQRTTTGAGTSTTDSSSNIVAALMTNPQGLPVGMTWRLRWIQRAAFTDTVTAGSGVTVTAGVVNASSVKDFLITVVNGTPAQNVFGTTVNGSPIIQFTPAIAALVTVGMLQLGGSAGLSGTTVIGVNVGAGTVTMNGNATSTNGLLVFGFIPFITVDGIGQMLL